MRILGKGEFSAKLSFKVAGVSKGAREAIEKAGGSVELIEVVPAAEKAAAKKDSVKKRKDSGRLSLRRLLRGGRLTSRNRSLYEAAGLSGFRRFSFLEGKTQHGIRSRTNGRQR